MNIVKIRSFHFVLDGTNVIGKVKTQAQAKRYIDSASSLRHYENFAAEIDSLISYAGAIEDEIGYEFNEKSEIVRVLQHFWPEVYDVTVNFQTRSFSKIFISGRFFHQILTFTADQVYSTVENLVEMSEFSYLCQSYGFDLADYKKEFRLNVPYNGRNDYKKVFAVGFTVDGRVIIQLANGTKQWTISQEAAKRRLSA